MADQQPEFEPRPGDPRFEYDPSTGGWTKPVQPDQE